MSAPGFREELEALINKHSMENGSNTPDFMLADYLMECLSAFDRVVNAREKWYGRDRGGNLNMAVELGLPPVAPLTT